MPCYCYRTLPLPHGAMFWFVVRDYVNFWSYSLFKQRNLLSIPQKNDYKTGYYLLYYITKLIPNTKNLHLEGATIAYELTTTTTESALQNRQPLRPPGRGGRMGVGASIYFTIESSL